MQIPAMFAATANAPEARLRLFAFLNVFAEDSSYRNRAVYAACATAFVRTTLSRQYFEMYFLDTLCRLAGDSVVSVRIGVSRAVSIACQIRQSFLSGRLLLWLTPSVLQCTCIRRIDWCCWTSFRSSLSQMIATYRSQCFPTTSPAPRRVCRESR